MNYEVVILEGKRITGFAVSTSNKDPEMGMKIGGLWQKIQEMAPGVFDKMDDKLYGLYTNYVSDVNGAYDAAVGWEIRNSQKSSDEMTVIEIPEGKYAKFCAVADITNGEIGKIWTDIWAMNLKHRAYTVDFEQYHPSSDPTKVPVNIFIALK